MLVHLNLDKFEFLRRNDAEIGDVLEQVFARLLDRYGADAVAVRAEDVWVITNCEAGLTASGKVNPQFVHSAGEVGLYPLPSNIKDWNGDDAPPFNQQTSLETNVFHYYLYLGHLKNKPVKTVGGLKLYRDLFRRPGAGDAQDGNAKILAGVVHGYFFSGTYRDRKIPLQHLLDGYANNVSLAEMMRTTKYIHAGTTIISNRERNINTALEALKAFRG